MPRHACPLYQLFLEQVRQKPHETALKKLSEAVTFAELHTRATAIQGHLISTDTGRRPVIAVACTSAVAEICAILAVLRAGGCFVPIDDQLPAQRQVEVIENAKPDAIISSSRGESDLTEVDAESRSGYKAAVLRWRTISRCVIVELDDDGRLSSGAQTSTAQRRVPTDVPPDTGAAIIAGSPDVLESKSFNKSDIDDGIATYTLQNRRELGDRQPTHGAGRFSGDADATTNVTTSSGDDDDLLYIMYTSGTTGTPKGVRGTRSGAINRIHFGWDTFPFRRDGELVCRRTPSCFVDSVAEIFSPLLAGVPLFLPARGVVTDPLRLVPALSEARVSRITLTPSLLSSLLKTTESLQGPLLPYLHTWFISGEALHPGLVLRFRRQTAQGTQLVNLYGSTEVSGDATYCTLEDIVPAGSGGNAGSILPEVAAGGFLIGKPLPNVYVSVVDSELNPVRLGQPGELLVGGVGVALGYHRRPLETAEKFRRSSGCNSRQRQDAAVHVPGLAVGLRVVRTGDRVVQSSADGPLYWLGRMDSEVKVRGVRVCLEEVERLVCAAAGFPSEAFAAVWDPGLPYDGGESGPVASSPTDAPDRGRLIGFVVKEDADGDDDGLSRLKHNLEGKISAAQLPTILVLVSRQFPLTTTGKVDKTALLKCLRSKQSDESRSASFIEATLDTTPLERQSLFAARATVARAVRSVLPESRRITATWLASPPPVRGTVPDARSAVRFTDLGGTSLMAVEAAYLASRDWLGRQGLSATTPASPTVLLDAADFLRGTLDDVALKLGNSQDTSGDDAMNGLVSTSVQSEKTRFEHSHVVRNLGSLSPAPLPQPNPPSALIVSSASPLAMRHKFTEAPGHFSPRGVKRQGPPGAADIPQAREVSPLLSISRAGADLVHSPHCLNVDANVAVAKESMRPETVALRVRWSALMSRCIDATPLLVVHNSTGLRVNSPAESAKMPEVDTDVAVRGCCCALGRISAADAGNDGTSSELCCAEVTDGFRDGTVYIGSHSGEFQAFNLDTGAREWSFCSGSRIESGASCSTDGSTTFVGCHDRHLYALERKTGIVSWSCETGDVIKCTPVSVPAREQSAHSLRGEATSDAQGLGVHPGALLVGSHDGLLRCLRQADGELLWKFNCGGALFASPAHDAHARVVYVATTKGRLVAIGRSLASETVKKSLGIELLHCAAKHGPGGAVAGKPFALWERQLPGPCFSTPSFCVATGALVVGCIDGGLYCFSRSGHQLWVCNQGQKPMFSSPLLLPSRNGGSTGCDKDETMGPDVIWGCHDGKLRCRRYGRIAWETDVDHGHPIFSSPFFAGVACAPCARPVHLVFACSVPGLVAALRLSDGVIVGAVRLPGEVFSSPVVEGRMGRLVVGCRDDRVYALDMSVTCSLCNKR